MVLATMLLLDLFLRLTCLLSSLFNGCYHYIMVARTINNNTVLIMVVSSLLVYTNKFLDFF